ncbi:MAG: EFR1 family ferrodoxin [Promethearchaeota archaeon]
MNVLLFFFSGTGITAKIAYDLADNFRTQNHSVTLHRLKYNNDLNDKYQINEYDLIGIGAPTYSFRAPRLVTKILNKTDFKGKPFFLFCSSGGMPGNTIWNLFRCVQKSGGDFLGDFSFSGITNLRSWMPLKTFPKSKSYGCTSPKYQVQKFSKKILEKLNEQNKIPVKKPIPNLINSIWSIFFTWRWQMAFTAGIKHVDKSKCTKCGLCATKICSSRAISLNSSKYPKFNEFRCVGCNGCLNLCPSDAIWSHSSKKHHQYDQYKEMILNN